MKIGIFYKSTFPDRGLFRHIELIHPSHELLIFCLKKNNNEKDQEIKIINKKKVFIFRKKKNNFYSNYILKLDQILFFVYAYFKFKVDIIIFREIHLVPFIQCINFRKTRTILDMKEPYPYAILDWQKDKFYKKIFFNFRFISFYEKIACKLVDRIIVVCKNQHQRLRQNKINKKIYIIENIAHSQFLNKKIKLKNNYKNRKKIIFHGLCDDSKRNIEIVIKAIIILNKQGYNFNINIYSNFQHPYAREIKKKYSHWNFVKFKQYVSFKKIPSTLEGFGIGLNPYEQTLHKKYTIPGKLYEYLSSGLMVLSTNNPNFAGSSYNKFIRFVKKNNLHFWIKNLLDIEKLNYQDYKKKMILQKISIKQKNNILLYQSKMEKIFKK